MIGEYCIGATSTALEIRYAKMIKDIAITENTATRNDSPKCSIGIGLYINTDIKPIINTFPING